MKHPLQYVLPFTLTSLCFSRHLLILDFENPIHFARLYHKLNSPTGTDAIRSILHMDYGTRFELCESILNSKFFSTKGIVPAPKYKRQLQNMARFYLRDDYELHFLHSQKIDVQRVRSVYLVVDHTVVMPSWGTHVIPLLPCLGIASRTSELEEYFVSDGLRGHHHFIFHRSATGSLVPVAVTEKRPTRTFENEPEKLEKFYVDQRRLFGVPSVDVSLLTEDEKFKLARLLFQSFFYVENSLVLVHDGVEEKRIQFMTSPDYSSMNLLVNVIRCTIEGGKHKSIRYIGGGFAKDSFFAFRSGDSKQVVLDIYFSEVVVLDETKD